jgi:dCMP deaminase
MGTAMRITRPQMFMDIAHVVAKRATCMRLNVGAVIVKGRSIVSIGYNGQPAGQPHCAGNACPGVVPGRCNTIHAELNALSHLPRGTEGPLDLYVTDSPCEHCYDRLKGDGRVKRIFFAIPYRISEHLDSPIDNELFQTLAPEVYRILPAGYVMDWRTKELVDVPT